MKLLMDQVENLTSQNALQHPFASKKPVEIEHTILLAKPLAKIQVYKNKRKKPMKYIQLPPQTVQLEGEIEALQHEFLDLKGRLTMMEDEKSTWEEEKKNMQKRNDELDDYITPDDRSPIAMEIKDMSEMSLKDLEITQLKEANQELKDEITAKEREDSIEEIRTLKEKVDKFEERVIG